MALGSQSWFLVVVLSEETKLIGSSTGLEELDPTTGSKACPRVHFGGVNGTHVLVTESGNVIRLFEWSQATVSKSLSGVKSEIG